MRGRSKHHLGLRVEKLEGLMEVAEPNGWSPRGKVGLPLDQRLEGWKMGIHIGLEEGACGGSM